MRPFGKYLRVNRILRFAIYIQNTLFEENNIELGLSKTIYLIARTINMYQNIYMYQNFWALTDSTNIKNIMQ